LGIRIVDVLYNSGSEASKKIVEAFAAGVAKVVEFANRGRLHQVFNWQLTGSTSISSSTDDLVILANIALQTEFSQRVFGSSFARLCPISE
jgi:hypothetical protein